MRDRPHPQHKLEWPGGVVPEWAKPQQNANKRRGKGKGPGGADRQGGSSPSKRERLQKVMAQSGHGSRRNIEILIAQGHITINGQVAKLGDSVGPGDRVKLDGKLLSLRFGEPLPRVLIYHKTTGEIVSRDDPEKRPTVFDKLPKVQGGRWVSVGRLDFNTEGLLIFTTNGELANRLTHPRFEVEREYAVRVMGELTEEQRTKLLTGVEIDGESCKFDSLEDRGGEGSNHWYHVILREGKNREVRRMMETVGLMVSRLMRVRFGMVELPGHIKRGMMREMEEAQIQDLLTFAGMNEPPPSAAGAEEEAEDEFDNIGNRVTEANRDRRGEEEPHLSDDLGNRVDARDSAGSKAQAAREPDGNRGTYGEGHRPPQPNQRRPHGAKPFAVGKKRGAGHGPQGQGQGQGYGQGQGKGAHGQHRKHVQAPVSHVAPEPLKAWVQGEGQILAQPRPLTDTREYGQGHPGGGKRGQGKQGQGNFKAQGRGQGQGNSAGPAQGNAAGPGQGNAAGPGQGKAGRHRRNKNRGRNRGAAEGRGDQQPTSNGNNEPS
jgi:23S rRNA pseudouridine2605 synthase